MSTLVTLELQGCVGILRIDNPPVNAMSGALAAGIRSAVERFKSDDAMAALVISARGRTFVAGGDIKEFSNPGFSAAPINATFASIEDLDKPVIAALHGTVLGAGLELAMACHYRIATTGTKLGLPEVLLGILPGSLGTQRLPRLIGIAPALDMMLTGRPISAQAALEAGLVDLTVEGDIESLAVAYAQELVTHGSGPRRTRDRSIPGAVLPANFFDKARSEAIAKKGAYPAPQRIVECVQAAATMPFEKGAAVEARLFEECRLSPESVALRHLFFAERAATKLPGVPDRPARRAIRKVGVLGAGTMGGGIAMNFANANIPVIIVETSHEALERGLAIVRNNYEASAAKGKLRPDEPAKRMSLLQGSLDYADLADCDVVIEAVFENLEIKTQVARRLGEVCKPGAIIASNTSTLDVNVLAQASGRPADFLGMHFFSPANVMRLLEIVRGDRTAADVLATVVHLAKSIGKVPVVSGVCYGFIGNRMLESYLREAEFLMMEGATPTQIDRAIQSLGLPMGPCRMLDLAGLDVAAKVVIERGKAGKLPHDPSYRAVVQKMMQLGRFGQKTGLGYYRYEGRTPVHDPEVETICADLAALHGIQRRAGINDEEIIERCLYPLINEGVRILDEGIAYRPGDIDLVWVNGYGFPDYLGGPMHHADAIGLAEISNRLDHYGKLRGDEHGYWTKSGLLSAMAKERRRIADWSYD